ncbi:MAG: HlyD family secretion protein [Cyanobacteria bacterium SZAS LIN-3]|nr:HlyD family secretion protein [Cyanobacteria bacterium SZAS LIN-3]MBS2010954.1 HlyD family secretion protein [Cyanobacteria bacterium SZAS TMP-1]
MAVSTDSYKETEDFKNTAVQGQSGPIPPLPSVADTAERRPSFKRLATGLLIVGLLVGAIAGGFSYYGWATTHEQTDDAYVDGHSSAVSSRVSGTVARVFIDDNQIVKKGDLLATLDPTDYQIKVDQAQAAVDLARKQLDQSNAAVRQYATTAAAQSTSAQGDIVSAQAMINMANSNVSQAQSAVVQQQHAIQSLKAKLWQAQVDYQRYNALFSKGAVSQEELDQARTTYTVAQADEQAGEQSLKQLQQKVLQAKDNLAQTFGQLTKSKSSLQTAQASKDEAVVKLRDVDVSKAQLEQAQANLKEANQNLAYTKIYSPIDGRIGRKNLEPGQRVDVGGAICSIFEESPWITANFKETQVGRMKPGQPVEVKIDSFGGRTFKGTVESISPASGARYALLPPENATGNFTKVVQRIMVKILFDQSSIAAFRSRIAPGMSTDVTVDLTK